MSGPLGEVAVGGAQGVEDEGVERGVVLDELERGGGVRDELDEVVSLGDED